MTIFYPFPGNDTKDFKKLIAIALGREKADLVISNAKLLNVYSGEILENSSISISGKWIAAIGNGPADTIGPKTEVVDAGGKTVIPGFIDGHAHLAWLFNVAEFLKYAIRGGATTVVTETMEVFPVTGHEGVKDFLASLNDQPIKLLATAPSMVSISRAASGISKETLEALLARKDILGLGETYWQAVLQEPDRVLPILNIALRSGKVLEGHSAGASGKKLMAYIASGVSSCHEPINAEEALERLRLGLYVMIREGSIRQDLEAISKVKDSGVDLRRLVLVSDGVTPEDLIQKGYMDAVVQKAIDCGFDPVTAVQMATLNPAERFSLDGHIGGIAPGKYADLLIIPDPRTITAEYVISNGRIIARNGKVLAHPRQHVCSKQSRMSVRFPRELRPSDFSIQIPMGMSSAAVRIIDQVAGLVTQELRRTLPVRDGQIRADVDQDIIKVAAVDRTLTPGKTFVGLIRGFRLRAGAIASSAAWDTSDIIVVGADDADMALAVNRIYALHGGAVACANGKILAELPLPVWGIVSDLPMEMLARQMEEFKNAAASLGAPFSDPLLTLVTLTGAAIPYLRICEEGLVNLKDGKTVGLLVGEPVL